MDSNLDNNLQTTSVPNNPQEEKTEEVIGEHDIVIDDDFQLKLEVSSVQGNTDINTTQQSETQEETEIGTEQSGSITF